MPDPKDSLSPTDRLIFGSDAKRHPITGFVLEQGIGALPPEQQARNHLANVERFEGKAAADALRGRLESYERGSATPGAELSGYDRG